MQRPDVSAFFDPATYTVTYVVADPATRQAAIIDPVLDYQASSGRTSTTSADKVIAFVREHGLELGWILETHVHADHLSGAPYIKAELGGEMAIGEHVTAVQEVFKGIFNLDDLATDGTQFDRLFRDEDTFAVGKLEGRVMHTPGHTPACITYVIGDAAFVGDTLFMPDFGSARTDFPGGSAGQLYDSIQRIFALPPETRMFMCHDYKAPGRDEFAWETSVAEQRAKNIHINDSVSRDEFIELREGRDSKLGMPALILPSIQVNVRAGNLPPAEDNDVCYLKIPLDAL
ncbi:MAG: MBL fold metallo-hydrolase [Woeseiaceae bacterium]|nr:MBL fold metallo-hydrolase [Woeseiaceae bacterium]